MCGGWRQDYPKPYELVLIRELVVKDGKTELDLKHVGYWGIGSWMVLDNETVDGTKLPKGTFKGMGIVNIYGWKAIGSIE